MQVTQERYIDIYSIHACREGEILINSPNPDDDFDDDGKVALAQSFIITPETLHKDWSPSNLTQIGSNDIALMGELSPEVLLLGSGEQLHFPHTDLLAGLIGLGIGYEVMSSVAACRTYNILASEGRRVAAAIIIEK